MNFPVYIGDKAGLQSPYEIAKCVYENEPCARTFMEDLQLHLAHGYVFNTPRLFLMGRPVSRDGDTCDIVCPVVCYSVPDCWMVYLAAGDISEFFKFEPFELQWFCWERNNKLRFYRRERLIWLLKQQSLKREALEDHRPHLPLRAPRQQHRESVMPTGILQSDGG